MKISSSDRDSEGQFRIYFSLEEMDELGTTHVRIYGNVSSNITVIPHITKGAMPRTHISRWRIKDSTGGSYLLRRITKMVKGGRIQITPIDSMGLKPTRRFRAFTIMYSRCTRIVDVDGKREEVSGFRMVSPSIHIDKQKQSAPSTSRADMGLVDHTVHRDIPKQGAVSNIRGSVDKSYEPLPDQRDVSKPPRRKYTKQRAGSRSLNSLINAVERVNVLIRKTPNHRLRGVTMASEHEKNGDMKQLRIYQDVVRQVHLN